MYSLLRIARVSLRAVRAKLGTVYMPTDSIALSRLGPNMLTKTMERSIPGNASKMSIARIMSISTLPPK